MKIEYCGGQREVYVPEHEDDVPALSLVQEGEPIEVPDAIAKGLLEQNAWQVVAPAKAETSPKPAAPANTEASKSDASSKGA